MIRISLAFVAVALAFAPSQASAARWAAPWSRSATAPKPARAPSAASPRTIVRPSVSTSDRIALDYVKGHLLSLSSRQILDFARETSPVTRAAIVTAYVVKRGRSLSTNQLIELAQAAGDPTIRAQLVLAFVRSRQRSLSLGQVLALATAAGDPEIRSTIAFTYAASHPRSLSVDQTIELAIGSGDRVTQAAIARAYIANHPRSLTPTQLLKLRAAASLD